MFSFKNSVITIVGIFALLTFFIYPSATPFAQVIVNADYSEVIVPHFNRQIFGLNVVHDALADPMTEPEGYAIYVDLADQCGVSYLHIPGSAYWDRYNWLTGIDGQGRQGYSISDWKRFSNDTDVGIVGIISPHLYYSQYGGQDPGAVVQWCIDNDWDPDKWRYWVVGCECYGDWDYDYVADVNEYCAMVNEISQRMKEVAPDIKIGVVFEIIWKPDWCQTVLEQCGDNIDFVDFHWYPHDGWTDPYGTMQHYPWLEHKLLPELLSHFNNYLNERQLDICIGEYDFWGMDSYLPYVPRNTTLADALAWGNFLGEAIRLGVDMAFGYDFVSGSSYGLLIWWEELEGRPLKYRPQTWVLGMWSKYFGQSMVKVTVEGSPNYILPHDGRQEWANVDCCPWDDPPYSSYQAIPVDFVTAYAGIDSVNNKASLILINKHNDSSYVLNINLSGLAIDGAESTQVYTLTTDNPERLMASNPQWDTDENEIPPPTLTTIAVGNSFNFTLGPHSMVTMRFPLASTSDAMAPAEITDLVTSNPTSNSITLSWTAPGDDGDTGMASQYDIRYSIALITEAIWSSATQVSGEPAPQVASTSQSMTVSGLDPSTIYYFAIKTADEVPNWSELSNVASETTIETANQPPLVDSVQCEKEGSWVDCSGVGYKDTITGVRANVTDSDGTISSVRFKLENLPDNQEFFDSTGSSAGGDWYALNNYDLSIEHSGDFRLIVIATDDDTAQSSDSSTWLVPWGALSASLISPAQDLPVYQNQAFSFQARLTCQGGECGDIEATLDPTLRLDQTTGLEDAFININYDQNADLDILCTYTWPQDTVANAILMKWDISSLVGLDVEDARLYLYLYDALGDDPYTLTVHKIINHNPVISAVTGYTYDGVNGWTPNNQCYNNIPLAQADIGPAVDMVDIDMNPGYKSFDVTALIQDWQAHPETNYGLLINSDALATYDSYRYFHSQEHTGADQRPYMIIAYRGGSSKGVISTSVGATPFYTTSSNPQIQAHMKAGDVFNQTWQVVATGGIGESYEFFVINHPTTYFSYISDVETPHINITIIQPPINDPPYFDPPTDNQSIDEGENLNFSIRVTDPEGDSITLSASNLPGNSTFTVNGTGSGTFGWTPDYSESGKYLVTFHASDGINPPVDDEVTIIVNDVDITPPVISRVQSSKITHNSVTISWDTDEPATSRVEYGLTTSYGSSTTLDSNLVMTHVQNISGLSSSTLYHYRVSSRDTAGNERISSDYTFTTLTSPDTMPPMISNVSATEITRHEAIISWNTDEVTTSLVEYGLTPGYGSSTNLDTKLVANHSQRLTGLHLDTLYHFLVRSRDVAGNEAMSQDYLFRTAPRPGSPRPIDPPDDITLGVPNLDLVILNGIDILGSQLSHLFEIDTTIKFNSLNLQQSTPFALDYVDDSTTLWTVPQELTTGTYYWRAYAYTNTFPSDTSNPSEVFSFEVASSDVIDTVYQLTLEHPSPNETVPTLRPVLVARLVSGNPKMNLLSCEFEVSEHPDFSNNVLSSERMTFSADRIARWEVNPDLKQNTRFYWRSKLWSGDRFLDITRTQTIFTGAIHVFPNPFKPSLGHSNVTFRNIPVNSTITVTTISGNLVKAFYDTQQTDVIWDVKIEDQKELASGVYLYWVSHAGEVSSGKLFVIR
jgi:hypothetical protein